MIIYGVCSDYSLFWLHHRSAMPTLLLGPRPERWDTVCVGHIYHSPVNRTKVHLFQVLEVKDIKDWLQPFFHMTQFQYASAAVPGRCS